jgi:hypothetical protein
VPYKGLLLVTQQVVPPGIAGFVVAAAALHANAGGAPSLSPLVFLVKDGKVVGHIAADARTPEAVSDAPGRKQGFWSRLFRSDR